MSNSVVPGTAAHQAPLFMEFSRQEYWSRLPFPSPGYLPDPGIKPMSFASRALAGGFFTTSSICETPWGFHGPVTFASSKCINTNNTVDSDHGACHLSRTILLPTFLDISVLTTLETITLYTPRDEEWTRKWQPTPVFLPGESQGRGSLVGCHLWGRTESDTTEAT